MPKLAPPSPPRGHVAFQFGFQPTFFKRIAKFPGVRLGKPPAWHGWVLVPEELADAVEKLAKERNIAFRRTAPHDRPRPNFTEYQPRGAHEYQIVGAIRAVEQESILLNYEPGLGKTAASLIATAIRDQQKPTLVVTPANVRQTWMDEVAKWQIPGDVALIETSSDWDWAAEEPADYIVTSYELLHGIFTVQHPDSWTNLQNFGCFILDEAHKIKNRDSTFAEAAMRLVQANPKAMRIALTATPVSDDPSDLWQIYDWLFPGRFGGFWQFVVRYCNTNKNAFGHEIQYELLPDGTWSALNKRYANELRRRTEAISHRVTKSAVGHLLPAFTVSVASEKVTERELELREIRNEFAAATQKHEQIAERGMLLAQAQNFKMALRRLDDRLEAGHKKVILLTWLKSTAKQLADEIEFSYANPRNHLFHFDGDTPLKKRHAMLAEAEKHQRVIGVISIASALEGINTLTQFDCAIYVELFSTMRVMVQSLGRFSRLNSPYPSVAELCVLKGTIAEIVALRLTQRADTTNKLFAQGQLESKISNALAEVDDTAELEAMRAAALAMQEEEY